MSMESLLELLRRSLPFEVPGGALALAERGSPIEVDEGRLILRMLSLTTDEDGTIMDLREQAIALGELADHPLERWHAYLEGTLRAAPVIVESLGGIDAILPGDVFAHFRVLDDRRLQSADDFAAALSDRERLAAWNQAQREADWREALEPLGLAEHADAIRALLRPSLRLRLDVLDGEDALELELGSTRLGGDPDLPSTMDWPSVAGEPMVFVAQFDLGELAEFEAARELPREGLLYFFYAPIPPEGWRLEHPVAVLHVRDVGDLVRRPAPVPEDRLPVHAIEFEEEEQLPALESSFCYEAVLPEAKLLAWFQSLARGKAETPPIPDAALAYFLIDHSRCDFDRPMHRLFGHPAAIQGDPYLDVEMARRGWDDWREGTPEAVALRRRALGWRLLLQVDAGDDEVLRLNQDGGFFYFWMPADALAAHDWGRARGCLQCH
jgi:hypothetical protein